MAYLLLTTRLCLFESDMRHAKLLTQHSDLTFIAVRLILHRSDHQVN
uniref:Uncharacterized protein n=1 Tax=Onchocerca volvulus TaxID=6282 RepID=A0A8R1TSU4_ONCVO